jgi:hypothetical protein
MRDDFQLSNLTNKQFSEIAVFSIKTAIAVFAFLLCLFVTDRIVSNKIADRSRAMGSDLAKSIEAELYRAAAAPDLPPEKKEQILNALRRLATKYRPYIDALSTQ